VKLWSCCCCCCCYLFIIYCYPTGAAAAAAAAAAAVAIAIHVATTADHYITNPNTSQSFSRLLVDMLANAHFHIKVYFLEDNKAM